MDSPSPSPSPSRQWRPKALSNLRNQFSYLRSSKDSWSSASSKGLSHATNLVNAFLSQKYMPLRDLGALKDMPNIRQCACDKLAYEQHQSQMKLISSYKEMVLAFSQMVKASRSMRLFLKSSSIGSPIIQFCDHAEVSNDSGDGGGVPIIPPFSIHDFEKIAQEIVDMFALELLLKRLIVVELISIKSKEADKESENSRWFDEIFDGEFNELRINKIIPEENIELLPPKLNNTSFSNLSNQSTNESILQVYLTTWLVNVNIDMNRVDGLFAILKECIGSV